MKIFNFEIKRLKSANFNNRQKATGTGSRLSKTDKLIIDKIVNRFKDRSRKDIQKWRKALLMAGMPDKPRRNLLQDIYYDLGTDGHLKSVMRLRKYTTLNTGFQITNDKGNVNEEATKFLNKSWFYKFLEVALDSIFYGYTLQEFESFFPDSVIHNTIPRQNVVPEQKIVVPDLTKDEAIHYDDPYFADYLIEIGEPEELGILNDIVPNLIWKRNVGQSWADFTEKFGIPMVTATTTAYDDDTIDKINYMLQQIGEASTGVFPQGTTLEFREADRTDAYQSYEHFIKYNKEEISVAIVGGTMITNDGSSRSQSEVHERNLDEKIAIADKRNITFLINDKLLPLLRRHGYTFIGENDSFGFAKSHNLKLDKYWNIIRDIIKEYDVDEQWLSDTFFVPITGKKKSLTKTPVTNPQNLKIDGLNLPNYPAETCCAFHNRFDAANNEFNIAKRIKKLVEQLASSIWHKRKTGADAARLTTEETLFLRKGLHELWDEKLIDAQWNAPDHLMLQMMEYNLFEFAASKTEARLASMTQLLIDKDKHQIRSFDDFKAEALKVTQNFNETWLRTEYNLAVATGQNAAAYARFMSEREQIPYVQYQTAGDSRVREEHQLLDGKIFNLNDKEAMRLWPPNGYGCRCEMLQYVGDVKGKVSKGKDWVGKMPESFFKGFDFNRGDLKQVFTRKQFYTKDGKLLTELNQLDYKAYGLKDFKDIAKTKAPLKLDKTITKDNVKELFKKSGDVKGKAFMGFKDYLNRHIKLFKDVFETHTKGKYLEPKENRHQLFALVPDIIAKPDEVWMQNIGPKNKWQIRYVKFFKDEMIVIDTHFNLITGLELKTWYKSKVKDNIIRKGLLLNNKPF